MAPCQGPYADSRTVQESNGGYVVSIPKQIAERYDIEKGDEVRWADEAGGDGPGFIPPETLWRDTTLDTDPTTRGAPGAAFPFRTLISQRCTPTAGTSAVTGATLTGGSPHGTSRACTTRRTPARSSTSS